MLERLFAWRMSKEICNAIQLLFSLSMVNSVHFMQVSIEMLKTRRPKDKAPSSSSLSTSPSAGSSPMPTPGRSHRQDVAAQPPAAPTFAASAPLHAHGSGDEAQRSAAVDLLMLHTCLAKLMAPSAGEHLPLVICWSNPLRVCAAPCISTSPFF